MDGWMHIIVGLAWLVRCSKLFYAINDDILNNTLDSTSTIFSARKKFYFAFQKYL